MPQSLLDYLAEKCRCEYLSDLHLLNENIIISQLCDVQPDDFSVNSWIDAIEYMTGFRVFEQS